jgi:hypothetical protein
LSLNLPEGVAGLSSAEELEIAAVPAASPASPAAKNVLLSIASPLKKTLIQTIFFYHLQARISSQ